jgi:hypothetical protein
MLFVSAPVETGLLNRLGAVAPLVKFGLREVPL